MNSIRKIYFIFMYINDFIKIKCLLNQLHAIQKSMKNNLINIFFNQAWKLNENYD